jgi:hypothetical protein
VYAAICCADGISCASDDGACSAANGSGRTPYGGGSGDGGSSALPTEYHWKEDAPDCGIGRRGGGGALTLAFGALVALGLEARRRGQRRAG